MSTSALALDIESYRILEVDERQENLSCAPSYRFIVEDSSDEEADWLVISKRGLSSAYAEDEPDYSD